MENPSYITNPNHGGKVTCHKCQAFIEQGNCVDYNRFNDKGQVVEVLAYFHTQCYNRYEHYYGLDKPLD